MLLRQVNAQEGFGKNALASDVGMRTDGERVEEYGQ